MLTFTCNFCGKPWDMKPARYDGYVLVEKPDFTVGTGDQPCPKCKEDLKRTEELRLKEIQKANGLLKPEPVKQEEPKKKRNIFGL